MRPAPLPGDGIFCPLQGLCQLQPRNGIRVARWLKKTHDKGLEIRTAVLGEAYVSNALKNADDFNKPFQELVTEYCWGAVWGREELPRKTRSMLNLAMISILNRPHELRVHIKGALVNGVTKDEIREIFMQVAIYAGVPAGVDSFRIAREVFAEIDKG
jgi:4-carboxymuconolactone decarboxylase